MIEDLNLTTEEFLELYHHILKYRNKNILMGAIKDSMFYIYFILYKFNLKPSMSKQEIINFYY